MTNNTIIKSISSVERFLLLFFIILVTGFLFLVGVKVSENSIIYDVLLLCIILLVSLLAAIGMFQYVKYKFIDALKNELIEDLDKYKNKSDNKVNETNSRIFSFEKNYSKKISKISKDYSIKAKEINDVKKILDAKLIELDRKAAYLEFELCTIKLENLKNKSDGIDVKKERELHYRKIIELNEIFPGICSDDEIASIHGKLS